MKKHFILTCLISLVTVSAFALPVISGTLSGCVGSSTYLDVDSATSSGGTWSSSNAAIASISSTISAFATVYGLTPGVVTISYTLGGTVATASYTVNPAPVSITGVTTLCAGTTVALTDATAGGTWVVWSGGAGVATVDAISGVVTGESGGSASIHYTLSSGCSSSIGITVEATATGYISGSYSICAGSTTTYTDGTATGGAWSSSNTAIATINATTGVATGVSAGTVMFSYTVTGICGLSSARDTVTVLTTTPTATLSGLTSVTVPGTITIRPSIYGGTWNSSNTAIATVDAYGDVTGVSPGTVTISYSLTGCSGIVTATTIITVLPFEGISGYVNFASSYSGPVLVWLITYNPTTLNLEAMDSTVVTCSGTSVYYQFTGLPTDSFRVKAAVSFDTSFVPAGYIPTYHTSSYYWHDADVIYHTSGTADINEDINMAAGVSLPGPGFIGGNVSTGANRGTSAGAPAVSLLVFAVNSTTGALTQQTYTDAAGNYSFTGLPYGTYFVHPELINYATIDYPGITLSSGSATMSNASFIQHTKSMVISPGSEGVKNVAANPLSIVVYPNPASDKLTLGWNETTSETGNISLADITGNIVYKTSVTMKAGTGSSLLSLPSLADGIYIFTVKSPDISYTGKIQILH